MRFLAWLAVILSVVAAEPVLAQANRSVVLVLDASGSMNARLANGQTRIEAAKAAVADLATGMDGATRLSFWAYGHQSPTQRKDCRDTALLVDFATVATNRADIAAKARALEARGYTPITRSLTLAAESIAKEESAERAIVLVSDGQETCEADPCVAAKAIAAADARLVIHTIGFGVGAASRMQLQCIASVARGRYFDAQDARGLATVLGQAAVARVATTATETRVKLKATAPSQILIKNTWAGASHAVTAADDGRQVADINGAVGRAEVPPGIYNVQFANGTWRGVEVKPGETTVLEIGLLQIEGGSGDLAGYTLVDPETEEVLIREKMISTIPLMPSRITIMSGALAWPGIDIAAGRTTTLRPARLKVSGAKAGEYKVATPDGRAVGKVSKLFNLPVPPGPYVIAIEDQRVTVELREGQTHEIKID
ncbi:MAG: VWA domain-containing protein [Bradyrhizobium sp.]